MSRAYQIKLSESQDKIVCAEDHVSTELELLNILPAEQMGSLLGVELTKEGFAIANGKANKTESGISISVDLDSLQVTVRAEASENVTLKSEKTGRYYNDEGANRDLKSTKERVEAELKQDLESQAKRKAEELQDKTTDELEQKLSDIRDTLNRAVNRTTAEALKKKAAQLGEIKEMTEDLENGSLTIVIEV